MKLITENGKEVEMDVEIKADNPQQKELCLSDKLFDEIGVTVEITYDEVGKWVSEKCRSLFKIPEDVEVKYEMDTRFDMVCYVRPANGRITEVFINLTSNIFWNNDSLYTMIGEIAVLPE